TKVAEAVIEGVAPIQAEQQRIVKDKAYLEEVLKDGAYRASKLAYKTLDKVYRKVGFIPRVR
ncbi:MAG: tryptophan--tRNA ligase, partial [Clostridia bacterium]|nr:tryptophan--tRNA ligase [Clostridia bacterium]